MQTNLCCICKRKIAVESGYTSAIFGRFHHSCANRAEDFVRAMAKINQCSTDHFLSEIGRPSLQTEDEPMAKYGNQVSVKV